MQRSVTLYVSERGQTYLDYSTSDSIHILTIYAMSLHPYLV